MKLNASESITRNVCALACLWFFLFSSVCVRCICVTLLLWWKSVCVCARVLLHFVHDTEYYETVWLCWMCASLLAAMNLEISFCPPSVSHTRSRTLSHTHIDREYCIWKQGSLWVAWGLMLAYSSLFGVCVGNFTHSDSLPEVKGRMRRAHHHAVSVHQTDQNQQWIVPNY